MVMDDFDTKVTDMLIASADMFILGKKKQMIVHMICI